MSTMPRISVVRPLIAAAVAAAAIAGLTVSNISYAADGDPLLFGTVRFSSGDKVEGVVVSARDPRRSFTTSVYTDTTGEYYFPPMEPGSYKVWAQTKGYEAGRAQVTLGANAQRQDFTLKPMKDFALQLSGDELVASLPEATPQDRKMKEVFRTSCGGCHN